MSAGAPEDALDGIRWLAWRAARAGRLALAATLLDGLILLAPQNLEAAKARADVSLRMGEGWAAHAAAARALQISPRDAEALCLHGRALLILGHLDEAMRYLVAAAQQGSRVAQRIVERWQGEPLSFA